jgi:uncharacterized protein YvpB
MKKPRVENLVTLLISNMDSTYFITYVDSYQQNIIKLIVTVIIVSFQRQSLKAKEDLTLTVIVVM